MVRLVAVIAPRVAVASQCGQRTPRTALPAPAFGWCAQRLAGRSSGGRNRLLWRDSDHESDGVPLRGRDLDSVPMSKAAAGIGCWGERQRLSYPAGSARGLSDSLFVPNVFAHAICPWKDARWASGRPSRRRVAWCPFWTLLTAPSAISFGRCAQCLAGWHGSGRNRLLWRGSDGVPLSPLIVLVCLAERSRTLHWVRRRTLLWRAPFFVLMLWFEIVWCEHQHEYNCRWEECLR